jgi:hypothetical protein
MIMQTGHSFRNSSSSGSRIAELQGNQTYTFVGKPNRRNNRIKHRSDDQLLTGNPYPSAIDADAFINDNIGAIESFSSPSIDGTLYFWNITQQITPIYFVITKGYAVRNLTGGAPASAIRFC